MESNLLKVIHWTKSAKPRVDPTLKRTTNKQCHIFKLAISLFSFISGLVIWLCSYNVFMKQFGQRGHCVLETAGMFVRQTNKSSSVGAKFPMKKITHVVTHYK